MENKKEVLYQNLQNGSYSIRLNARDFSKTKREVKSCKRVKKVGYVEDLKNTPQYKSIIQNLKNEKQNNSSQ